MGCGLWVLPQITMIEHNQSLLLSLSDTRSIVQYDTTVSASGTLLYYSVGPLLVTRNTHFTFYGELQSPFGGKALTFYLGLGGVSSLSPELDCS